MIADKVFQLDSFKNQYRALLILSVSLTIDELDWSSSRESIEESIDWNNILGIASILSHSSNSDHLDAALRISQTCLISNTAFNQKNAAVVILENLTNGLALGLAVNRGLIDSDFESHLPLPFKIQTNQIKLENSVTINDKIVSLNRFQKTVYDSSRVNSSLSISAPTSAGKSFILYQLLIDELKKEGRNVVYIVPTRALISQVEDDFRELLKSNGLDNINLTTVPLSDSQTFNTNLYIFTQERLHWFLMQSSNTKIDFVLVDEAHKIDNGNRGVLLQRKLEEVIDTNPEVRVFFSSPFTSNPEVLLEGLNIKSTKDTINTEFVAVNQNLLYVSQVKRKPLIWNVDLVLRNEKINLGTIVLRNRPTSEAKKIAFITEAISADKGGNLVYANGAAEAEKYAKIIKGLSSSSENNPRLLELIKLVKNTIHKDYSLGDVLKNRVAFHYGNIPLLIRNEIESLFKSNDLKYLVCTSTLLEGVNLPATSVFIRKPTRGKGKPLNENDFWNLAGRAGRWGKEFSGNIVCIDPDAWDVLPSPNKRKQKIVKALDIIQNEKADLFLDFVQKKSPRPMAEANQDFEFAFSYYYSRFKKGQLKSVTSFDRTLTEEFQEIDKDIIIPNEIIYRNPGISPVAMQQLYEYFKSKSEDLEGLIPVYPEDSDSFSEYTKLVGRIGKTLASFPPQLNESRAILLINWMSGKPLSFLIRGSLNSYKRKGIIKKVDSVCRDTMEQVENFARFRFAKESSCYVDILRFFLTEIDRLDLLDDIPELNLWLEFGVSQETQLSLLSLGLSRNTVIAISEFINETNLSKQECMDWLNNVDLSSLDLSPIMIADLNKLLVSNQS